MQESILYYFQRISSPFLDFAAEAASFLGEESIYILVITVFYWALSRKKGFILAAVLVLSLFLNTLLKIVFHTARPFEVLTGLEGKRLVTATGYAFPSGHTQGAAGFYMTLIYLFRTRRIVWISGVIIILMVGISRIYLGVHWPVDVLGGWFLGILTAWLTASRIDRLWGNDKLHSLILTVLLAAAAVTLVMIGLELMIFRGNVKTDDFFKSAGILLGTYGGFLPADRSQKIDCSRTSVLNKSVRVFTGLLAAFGITEGLDLLFPDYFAFHLIRYGLLGLWIVWLCPEITTPAEKS